MERANRRKGALTPRPENKTTAFVLGSLLFLATAAAYAPIIHHEFLNYDDDDYVVKNAHVINGLHWDTIRWAFTSNDQANWHPITWLSHALDCQLFELEPGGHHTTNLLLHACNAILLFLILRSATRATIRSFLVAALFGIHPFNVGTVAWVAERKSLLCMLFSLLAIGAYVRFCAQQERKAFAATLGFFALALASKPMAVPLPLLLLILDYWPLQRIAGWTEPSSLGVEQAPIAMLVWEKVPMLVGSGLSCAVTLWAQRAGGALRPLQLYPFGVRLENAIYSCALYVEKTFWPSNFSVYYPHPGSSLALWKAAVAGSVLLAISAAALACRKKHPQLLAGWTWFVVALTPVIGIVQVGDQGMADRYAYVPLIGLFIPVVWYGAQAIEVSSLKKIPSWAAAIPVLGVLTIITEHQLTFWQDSVSLWSHSLQVTSNNLQVEKQLANAMVRQGDVEEALPHLVHITSVDPNDVTNALNLGSYYASRGNVDQAQLAFQNVLHTTADRELSSYDRRVRASAFLNLGFTYTLSEQYDLALNSFRSASDLEPAVVDEVIGNLRNSLESGYSPSTGVRLSLLLRARNQEAAATAALDEVLRLAPDFPSSKALADYVKRSP